MDISSFTAITAIVGVVSVIAKAVIEFFGLAKTVIESPLFKKI